MRARWTVILGTLLLVAAPATGLAKNSSAAKRSNQRTARLAEERYQRAFRVALGKTFSGENLSLSGQVTGAQVFLALMDDLVVRKERQAQENARWQQTLKDAPNGLARWFRKTFTRPADKIGFYELESLWGPTGYYRLFDEGELPAAKAAVRALETAGVFERETVHHVGNLNLSVTDLGWEVYERLQKDLK